MSTPRDPSSPGDRPGPPPPAPPLPLSLELPLAELQAANAPTLELPRARSAKGKGRLGRVLLRVGIALVALALVAVAVALWVVPWYVRRACIEQAAAHGIDLAVDDVGLDASGVHLLNVHATSAALPGASLQAPQVDVELSGWQPQRLTAHRATITLKGRWGDVSTAFTTWRASGEGGAGGTWAPVSLAIDESRVAWQDPFAENARVEAVNTHAEITWATGHAETHARSDALSLVVPAGTLGPWRVDIDHTAALSRLRIALDPAVPEACTVLLVGDDTHTTSLDVTVPRSPLARIGVPPKLLGLEGGAPQVEAKVRYAWSGARRADLTGQGGVFGVQTRLPRPLDATWDLSASGDPKAGLDVTKAHLTAGPLTGAMTGTIKAFDDGFRVDLAWTGGPVPCSAFANPTGDGSPLDLALQLRKLALGTGLARVDGNVSARGTLALDSRDLGAAKVQLVPEITCQVGLF